MRTVRVLAGSNYMKDEKRTKADLIEELRKLRRKSARLEKQLEGKNTLHQRTGSGKNVARIASELRDRQYHALFQNAPVPLQVWDYSGIRNYLGKLAKKGIKDFRGYFSEHPSDFTECASLLKIVETNKKVLELFHARSHEDLVQNAHKTFSADCFNCLMDGFDAICRGVLHYAYQPHNALTLTGERIHIITEYSVVPGYEETFERVLISQIDITESKRVQRELEESDTFKSLVLNSLPMAFFVAQPFGSFGGTWVSDQISSISGFTAAQFMENSDLWSSRLHDDDRERVLAEFALITETGSLITEYRWKRSDGQYRWFRDNSVLVRDGDGNPDKIIGTWLDITESKTTEQTLQSGEERLSAIMDSLDAMVYVADMDTYEVLYINEYARQAFGDVTGQKCWKTMQSDQTGPCDFCTNKYLLNHDGTPAGPYRWEFKNTQNDRWYFITDRAIKWSDGRLVRMEIATDITERKRIEEQLAVSEERFRSIIETEPECVKIIDRNGGLIMMNPAGLRMIEVDSLDMVKGQVVYRLVDPEHRDAFKEMVRDVFQGKERKLIFKMTGLKGSSLWLDTISVPLRDKEGNVTALLGVTRDITEQRKIEASLRESQEVGNIGSYSLDIETGKWISSEFLDRIFGIDENYERDVEGWVALVHPDWKEYMHNYLVQDVIGKKGRFDKEYKIIRHNDGQERWLHGMGKLEVNKEGVPVRMIGTIQDITDRKDLEIDVTRMKNLESLGILAGGIAHDFNNLLAGIVGNVSLARMRVHDREYVTNKLSEIEGVSLLAQNLTRQLLTFSKGGMPMLETMSIGSIVRSSVLFALSGSNISSEFIMNDDLWPVEVDEGQMNQVFSNIVINARDAMPEGGMITIRADNVDVEEGEIGELPGGHYVKISIQDEGEGIAPEDLPRIFDPYFSKKERGADKGTGLGLSICHSIILKHGGYIGADSEVGKGTVITMYLPASANELKDTRRVSIDAPSKQKGEKVLVMDDDRTVRNVARELLLTFGFDVEVVEDGAEAVKRYREAKESGKPFNVVLLDLTVQGGMGGVEAFSELRKIDPSVKAVIVSGYADDSIVSNYAEHGFAASLTKPFRMEALRDVMNGLLTGKRS